jgi:hypothetical protein
MLDDGYMYDVEQCDVPAELWLDASRWKIGWSTS